MVKTKGFYMNKNVFEYCRKNIECVKTIITILFEEENELN